MDSGNAMELGFHADPNESSFPRRTLEWNWKRDVTPVPSEMVRSLEQEEGADSGTGNGSFIPHCLGPCSTVENCFHDCVVQGFPKGASGSTAETIRGSLSLRGSSDRIFENSREGHGVEEQHQSISNLVAKLYYGDNTVGEDTPRNRSSGEEVGPVA
ncbi:hypothetical protein Goklo_012431 [Gossypium klotzschianum]|uniref:Uncharacterized protein n=1 Tax=Gossypium klotzschianum TaxID=34286 RepID=A0A7J8VCY0_9ROSI|nr:hypothetical protein [Gossypium klotzschianum]